MTRFSGLLARMHAKMQTLPQDVANEVMKAERDAAAAESEEDRRATALGRSLEEIAANSGLTHRPDAHLLECTPCLKWSPLRLVPVDGAIVGMFSTEQELFRLRFSIGRHLKTTAHISAVEKEARMKQRRQELKSQGMANGRAVYANVKEARPFVSYERTLLMLDLNGVGVGTINHGRKFAKGLVMEMASVIMSRMQTFLDTPCAAIGMRKPSIAIAADKSTHLRRTSQLVSATMMVEGELVCIMVDRGVVPPHRGDGQGLAGMVIESTMKLMPLSEQKERVAAFAFDGQYIKDDVAATLRPVYEGKPQWLTIQWDPAHKAELVLEDLMEDREGAEQLSSVKWLRALPPKTSKILHRFQMGKHFEDIRMVAAELEVCFRNPCRIRTDGTRFVDAALRVYRNLLQNFTAYVHAYTEAATIPEGARTRGSRGSRVVLRTTRNDDEQSALDTLHQLTDQLFVGYLLAVCDIYAHFTEVRNSVCECV
eukprot:GHVU01154961.1.p1 GENE.GHVU01154961.1~~GHVU01154961.1.p1  ORF type:complete len:483 (-),score=74.90 GHVU01154961.1:310-1758(-)